MVEILPGRVGTRELYPDPDVLERTLSLAVEVRDVATGGPPAETVVVTIERHPRPGTASAAGVHLFVGLLPDPPFTVKVEAGKRYFEAEKSISASDLDASPPVATVTLTPTTAYDFPSNLTLVRGFLRYPAPENQSNAETVEARAMRGVGGAVLSLGPVTVDAQLPEVPQLNYVVETTPTGEFALPIPLGGPVRTVKDVFPVTSEPVSGEGTPRTRDEYRWWVAIDGSDPAITIRHEDVAPNDGGERVTTIPLQIEPQTTNRVELELTEGSVRLVSPTE